MLLRLVLCVSIAPSALIAQGSRDTAAPHANADTAIILASTTGATKSRFVLRHSAGVHLNSTVLESRGDTVSTVTPATLIFDRAAPIELELYALTGDLRVQTRTESYDCIVEGPVLKFERAASGARLRFVPDPHSRTACVKRA